MDDKVTQIFLERLIQNIEESGTLPWERPFNSIYAFNYFSMHEYTGINRWILPAGEYMTANQINQYNREHKANYRFAKGIKWYPVFFVKDVEVAITEDELPDSLKAKYTGKDCFLGYDGYNYYICRNGSLFRCKKVRRYYQVADRKYFVDENGNTLPSRVENGEVTLTFAKPQDIISKYISREGITVTHDTDGAYYIPKGDIINVPDYKYFISESRFYSTWFHEMIHSTGADGRLCRVGVAVSKRKEGDELNKDKGTRKYVYSMEECIAELGCALLCSEAGFQGESMSDDAYKNHASYIQGWMKYFKENKDDIIWTMSCAEKAFRYVLDGDSASSDSGSTPIK